MESLLVRALESKLKYWLRSFSRDQFKLQGRSVHLLNLDLNGDVLHAAIGLPPTLRVAQARVGKFELKLPSITNVNSEPVVIEIDNLDMVLVETSGSEHDASVTGAYPATTPTKASTSYGFADKIADGMTIAVGTVNLMLETRGGGGRGGAAWTPPLASITIRNLLLYTTNEHWKVVNLKEAREFFATTKCIYIFKKLEWESLSVDLLPHPDMFADEVADTDTDGNRDDAGAKRMFFGGERFLDGISGEAYITMHRTELNNPIALELQVHMPEALCPALSEPGLRALLRFMTGVYVCLNRGDVDPTAEQSDEAAGRTMVKVTVDHIFLCIKDADFQLELLMQSLNYVRASTADGDCCRTMSRLELGHLFLRDVHSTPTCILVQPSMRSTPSDSPPIPSFASEKLWPRIYPLDSQLVIRDVPPMLCMFASQMTPAPAAPNLASQMVVQCQPLTINLQEESCIRIASFLADGVVVGSGVVLPDTSLNAVYLSLKEFDLTVPLKSSKYENEKVGTGFTGARLHVEGFMIAQSPFLSFRLLNLDEDPACFAFWKGQPVDSSQQRWVMRATYLSIALETESCDDGTQMTGGPEWAAGLWRCVVMADPCIEVAMVTADGKALLAVPPPGGIVRLGASCKSYTSNASSEQLLFVLRMYGYIGEVSRTLLRVSKGSETGAPAAGNQTVNSSRNLKRSNSLGGLAKIAPDDSAVTLKLGSLEIRLLESVQDHISIEGPPLVQISSRGISLKATHRMLGGAAVLSSAVSCQDIRVECVETERCSSGNEQQPLLLRTSSTCQAESQNQRQLPDMRAVLWIGDERGSMAQARVAANGNPKLKRMPFLDVAVVHMIPLREEDFDCHSLKVTAKVAGVRLGGGMAYTEALLHRFGVLGPDGGPGEEVLKVIKTLSSGPLAELLRPASGVIPASQKVDNEGWEMGKPDEIDVDIQLQDWLFALEGSEGVADHATDAGIYSLLREQKCWHSTFRCLRVIALGRKKAQDFAAVNQTSTSSPVQEITMQIEGLQALKPHLLSNTGARLDRLNSGLAGKEAPPANFAIASSDDRDSLSRKSSLQPVNLNVTNKSGLDFAANLIESVEDGEGGSGQQWVVESIKVAVKEPMELKATKVEVDYLVQLGKLEVQSASRVAAGILKLLQLHGSFGQSAIDQLHSIGSGSLEKILTPSSSSRGLGKEGSISSTPSIGIKASLMTQIEPTVTALEAAIKNSRDLCVDLESSLSGTAAGLRRSSSSSSSRLINSSLNDLSLLVEQVQSMEALLATLRNDCQ